MNDIDDACEGCPESNAPLPADELGESCAGDGDCANLSVCRAGVCYVPKNKFISVTPGNAGAAVGLRVRLAASSNFPAAVGNTWWVQPHDAGDPPDIFRLGCTPHYQDWSGEPGVIHIGDPEIVTDAVYDVQALDVRCDPADEDRYSDPLNLPTVGTWGDVVGPSAAGVYSPPNGAVNFDDIQAGVFGFQGNPSPPAVWVDVDPDSPNATVNFGDIQRIVQAFQGAAYPYAGPTTCP